MELLCCAGRLGRGFLINLFHLKLPQSPFCSGQQNHNGLDYDMAEKKLLKNMLLLW